MKHLKITLLLMLLVPFVQAGTDLAPVVARYETTITGGRALASTPLFVSDRTALYRLTGLTTIISPGTLGTICFFVAWTDGDTGQPISNGPPCTSVTTVGYGPNFVYTFYAMTQTPISISTTLNSVTGTPAYNMHYRLEQF